MNRFTFDQINAFLHVVRLGGFARAADALSLTQPAITARIKALEHSLGAEVFARESSGPRLTQKGNRLLPYAEALERLHGLVERDVMAADAIEGRLRLGVSETIAQCWLPQFIGRLHHVFPRIEIEFHVDISLNLRAALLRRAYDLVVLLGPVSDYEVENADLPGFDLDWYASAQMPDTDDIAAYFERPVLTYARQTRPYREIRALLTEKIGPGVALFPSSSLSTCFRLVEADLGIAALPRALGQAYVARGTVRRFNPGWVPPPLRFTASHFSEPARPLIQTAATLAQDVARTYAGQTDD